MEEATTQATIILQDQERVFHPVAEADQRAAPAQPPATSSDHDHGGGGGGGGVSRSIRTHPPADYIIKIQNFSMLLDAIRQLKLDFTLFPFEAGGYNWNLLVYPRGDVNRDASDHISVYLVVADRDKLPAGWEINVNFKLFLYNQKEDHYLTLQDIDGRVTRFNQMRTESGFAKFISHTELMSQQLSNGYWLDDSIVIGAEVFVIGNKRQLECLFSNWWPTAGHVSCELFDFTKQHCASHHVFPSTAGNKKWKLEACIEEVGPGLENGLKISLTLLNAGTYFGLQDFMRYWFQKEDADKFVPQLGDVYAEWGLRVRNQKDEAHHINKEGQRWFRANSRKWGSWCCTNVISLSDLTDETKGYIVNDLLIIDVVFDVIREVKNSTSPPLA